MFSYLKGILAEKNPGQAVIDCGGVGYEVEIPMSTFEKLPVTGKEAHLWIHFSMSDDGIRLFGFNTPHERNLYRMLIAVSRIGPKLSLAILSALPPSRIVSAIREGDAGLLSTVPGLGKKTAQRLILEMKDRIELAGIPEPESTGLAVSGTREALSALTALGYRESEVLRAWKEILPAGTKPSTEEIVKKTIKHLYNRA